MLIQFSFENFRSIKNQVTLSMLASADKEHLENTQNIDEKDNYLKTAIIYGANASGKSNVLSAFYFMVNYVLTSHEKQLNLPTGRVPFRFDPVMPELPSAFEVIFSVDKVKYIYGFAANDKEVVEEYLYYYPNKRKAVIFERSEVDRYRFTTDIDLQDSLKERNSANKLYLSTAANWNYKKALPVFNWFVSCRFPMMGIGSAYGSNGDDLRNDEYRARIAKVLQTADFGISGINVRDQKPDSLLSMMGILDNIEMIHQVKNSAGEYVSYKLNMSEESQGTNSFFRLIGDVDKALKSGTVLIADEMDAFLHPLLTQKIISLFNSNEENPHGAQLIFSSHNASLMDMEILRRDQIWFTEKDAETGATEIFSLIDFSVRSNAKIEKGYLQGKFGAIPFLQGGIQR